MPPYTHMHAPGVEALLSFKEVFIQKINDQLEVLQGFRMTAGERPMFEGMVEVVRA